MATKYPLIPIIAIVLINPSFLLAQSVSTIRYVALGDSYTIGTGASVDESWPSVLTRHLQKDCMAVKLAGNLARAGWTTQDVIDQQLPVYKTLKPTAASLLIGVNDWVQGVDAKTFQRHLKLIIDRILAELPAPANEHFFIVTIPDFSVTPSGRLFYGGRDVASGVAEFNAIIKKEADDYQIPVMDIFPLSKEMGQDPALLASDGLHPSALEYARWERMMYPHIFTLLKKCCLANEAVP